MVKVAINGFGRIGRCVLRAYLEQPEKGIEFVAVNDPMLDAETAAYLMKYDSVMGIFKGSVEAKDGNLVIDGKTIKLYKEREPEKLPWKDLNVEIVVESTGVFRDDKGAGKHITAGAKKVIITAPAKGSVPTFALGINEEKYNASTDNVVSMASCTTNCLAPVAKVVNEEFGIEEGLMTTIHSYTGDQRILDAAHSDPRRARAAALNIVPTTTGAAKAVGLVMPELQGKLNGFAIRVPTPNVSVVDVVFKTKKDVTAEAVNEALKKAANGNLKGILEVADDPLVSTDFIKNPASSIVDSALTMSIGKNMVKVISWYDNEWGYSTRVVEFAGLIAKKLPAKV
jgi:glyceraldehyde 3-phosphate dehydrogenase